MGDDVEYEVGAVLDHRDGVGGQREYRVAWAGFPDEEQDTWEPSQNLTEHAGEPEAGEVLTAYERDLAQDGSELAAGDEPEFEVEAVLDHRDGDDGQREYLVAWVGYPDEEQDTWEPSQNLTEHAGEILTAYEARLPPRRRQPTAAAISGRGRGLGRGRARGRGRGRARGRGRRPGPAKTTLNAAKLNENYKWCTTATHDCGELGDRKCVHCRALLYTSEVASHSPLLGPGYNRGKSCCADGKVVVPAIKFDPEIGRLFQDASQEVHQTPGSIMVAHARKINNALSMASLKIDEVFPGRGHYNPGLTIRGK